jgi:GNAT superfamily N-acetyltransferase
MKSERKRIILKDFDQLNGSPVAVYAMACRERLPEAGFYEYQWLIGWDDPAIVAFVDSMPVGILVYRKIEWQKSFTVVLGFVEMEHRRKGIYKQMWNQLKKRVKKTGYRWIIGATHPDNKEMTAAMESCGRRPFRVMYEFEVK